jgi:Zinc carboxypeptidase
MRIKMLLAHASAAKTFRTTADPKVLTFPTRGFMKRFLLALTFFLAVYSVTALKNASAEAPSPAQTTPAPQKLDDEYTKLIKEYLQDSRITTELVDHMPASDTVPSPLKFFGRIPGTPGELTYSKDINRYYEALAQASPRAKFWKIGKSEEGRDQVLLAIADEDTIKDLDRFKSMLAQLTDPRKITEEQAQALIHTAKPIYWITSGIHSPETGGPEMLIELAYRLMIEETPFIQAIRNNVIVLITPVVETDGREKQVDSYYYGKKTGKQRPPLMYWGKYVAHDNNRDGMGQLLKLTQNITREVLEWHPTVLHDLHEAQSYLYVSTGTGPYNNSLDPIAVNEWWLLAETEVMEMAKRGVPGVFTYGFYDGWVPNYLFWIAITHNGFGRFYEVQGYGPDLVPDLHLPDSTTSREWYRANPPLSSIKWGPRNNTNIQESAMLFALHKVAQDRNLYLEDYWMKNKRAIDKGRGQAPYAWVIPAGQRRRADAADMINALRAQGLEVQIAGSAFKAGTTDVAAGDYIIRADQPYRTLADMYFSVQNYPVANPRPYDDTGWTMQYMRNITLTPVKDRSILDQPMTLISSDVRAPGRIDGSGDTLIIEHTTDNALMSFRFKNARIKMLAAEDDFELRGHKFRAGTFIIPNAKMDALRASIQELGLSAWAVASAPAVKTHEMEVPRIGYVHSWQNTQDEGWVRAALDHYGVPYKYFADQKLREGNLRAKYDVIIYPDVAGTSQSILRGIPKVGPDPIPYKKSNLTPNLGALDESDDIRGGMEAQGLAELAKFVEAGGTLITEGSTSAFVADYGLAGGVSVEHPAQLFARGSILRGQFTDLKSPIAYGYDQKDIPVYFNQDPVFAVAEGRSGGGGGSGAGSALGQNVIPNAVPIHISPYDQPAEPAAPPFDEAAYMRQMRRLYGGVQPDVPPRIIMQFPKDPNDMLLSGTLSGGQAISERPLVLDANVGKGHVVMFALRPFWRWQTQGTYFLGFNAILNWNHLDAGKPEPKTANAAGGASK